MRLNKKLLLLQMLRPQTRPLALTVSGNEMADSFGVRRDLNVQGDGLIVGTHGGVGSWLGATNLTINGNATTNTTGITDHSSTTTRVTTGVVKFGTTAFEVVSANAAANEGPSQVVSGGAAATKYTVSAWAWLISGAATVRATLSDTVAGKQGGTAVVLTAIPQRITVTATTGVAGGSVASYIETTVQQAGTWRIGGWQSETNPIATPYIQTDGGTAARSDSRIRAAVSGIITATQGWCVTRLQYGALPTSMVGRQYIFSYADGGGDFLWFYLNNGNKLGMRRSATTSSQNEQAIVPVLGDRVTVAGAWTAGFVRTSLNGAAWSQTANTNIPTLASTTIELLENQVISFSALCGQGLWQIFGSGTLSDSDVAFFSRPEYTINPPRLHDCPGNATLVWDCTSQIAQVR